MILDSFIASPDDAGCNLSMLCPILFLSHSNPFGFSISLLTLDQTGEHNVALLLVLVTELRSVRALLILAPLAHPRGTPHDEDNDRPVAADNDDTHPRDDLEHVVRAGHNVEPNAVRNLPLSRTRTAQARQVQVHQRIADLSERKDQAPDSIDRRLSGRRSQSVRLVDEVGAQQAGAGPVEVAVAEDVDPGHRGGRELVDEQGLELTLEEVQLEHGEDDPLSLG